MGDIICYNCQGKINIDIDKYVLLKTCENGSIIESNHYHFECWKSTINKMVSKRLGAMQNQAMKQIGNMFKGAFSNEKGNFPGI